ncbi:hypothetical protein A15D_00118 [Alcanivorax sp. MD8A]|uniref:TIGR04283 family arsenosugar biosynthesis glycosyltransferase n=1 Tax=Alcanivorax sp. MD8A TaxID=1177157 RepID=UPI000C9ACE71|nr:TIGR04283 family arsenosugar biosynthesis glycosyltransferase [Alcanivorax sp. MD8A]PNE04339.1 hypothetical protein A15D_00118 [Alcanivorax sp. MD8A]
MTSVSVIVPLLNEAGRIQETLTGIRAALREGDELIVVDGGSSDSSAALAAPLADRLLTHPAQRAGQMNAGAAEARGEWLWFIHADNLVLPSHRQALSALSGDAGWGRFDVCLDAPGLLFATIGQLISLRSRITGIATGDQALFVRRSLFEAVGGFPPQPLMEDVALSACLRRHSRPVCLRPVMRTSARRWQSNGVWRTIGLMWRLRYRYWRGEDPASLHRAYYGASQQVEQGMRERGGPDGLR